MVILHTLGRCAIETDAGIITPRAPVVFALGLKLLMHPGRRVTRGTLLSAFWASEENEGTRRRLLRKNLSEARARGLHIHSANTDELWIPSDQVRTDVDCLSSESVETLLTRDYTVLPEYTPDPAWDVFSDQVDDFRERTRTQIITTLTTAIERQKAEGEWRAVQQLAALLLTLDDSHVRAHELHARATRILRRQGVPESALSAYEDRQRCGRSNAASLHLVASTSSTDYLAARDTPFQGRKDDLAVLTSSFFHAARAQLGAVYIHGPAGVGKSRLIREFVEIAKADGAEVVQATCDPEHINQPLAPFVTLVPQLLRVAGPAARTSPWVGYLDSLLRPTDAEFSYASKKIGIPGVEDRLQYALQDLIDVANADRLLVVIIENTHWCHKASWSLFRQLLSCRTGREREQLFIFTSREPWHEDMLGPAPISLHLHQLQQLDADTSRRHICEYLTAVGHTAEASLIEWWIKVGEGNPYFHEELVNHWIVTGEDFHAPPSLTAVIDARIGKLTLQSLHLLQMCAALGEHTSFDRLLTLFGEPRHKLIAGLDELGRSGMLTMKRDAGRTDRWRIMCRHDLLADQALKRLTPAARTILHESIGTMLEADLNDSPTAALLWSCAEHWYRADNTTRAVVLGLACVSHLWNLDLTIEAIATCRKTLKYCLNDECRYRVLHTLAYLLYRRSDWDNLFIVLAGARRLQHQIAPTESYHDELELLALDAAWHAERLWQPILDGAMRCVFTPDADRMHRVRAGIIALKIATNLGDAHVMNQVYKATRQSCNDSTIPAADRLTLEMIYHAICGDPQTCVNATQTLIALTRESCSGIESLRTLLDCASALIRAGHAADGTKLYVETFERSLELGMPILAGQATHRLLIQYLDRGEIEAAGEWANRYAELGRPPEELWNQRAFRVGRARLAIHRGQYDEADALLGNGVNALWNEPTALFRAGALAAKIRLEIARGGNPEYVAQFTRHMMADHEMLCEMGSHDFETASLYLGLRYSGANDAAHELLTDYIRRRRQNNMCPTQEILDAVKREAGSSLGLDSETQLRNFLCMWQ